MAGLPGARRRACQLTTLCRAVLRRQPRGCRRLVGVDVYSFDFKLYHIAQHVQVRCGCQAAARKLPGRSQPTCAVGRPARTLRSLHGWGEGLSPVPSPCSQLPSPCHACATWLPPLQLPEVPVVGPAAQALPADQKLPPLLIINMQLPMYGVRRRCPAAACASPLRQAVAPAPQASHRCRVCWH